MTSNVQSRTRTGMRACLVCVVVFLMTGFCFGQPAISLSPSSGPPTTSLRVSGSGFAPYAKVDIYFGAEDKALAMADGSGSFSQIAMQVPASALPGTHWVSAVERSGHNHAQVRFEVRTDWDEYLREDMRRFNPHENVLNVNNVGNMVLKWSFDAQGEVWGSPAVVNGLVYIASGSTGIIYALKASTGAVLWSYQTGNNVNRMQSSAAVRNGVVYIGADDGNVYALKARDGTKVWSYQTGGVIGTCPTIVNGVVYVGSSDSNIYALNASTGALLWSYQTGNGGIGHGLSVAKGLVYFGTGKSGQYGTLYALDAKTGTKRWTYNTEMNIDPAPTVANGVVYFGTATPSGFGMVFALQASTGKLLWVFEAGSWVRPSPAVAYGIVYAGSCDGNEYALNAKTGALLWNYTTGACVDSSAAVANGVVYVGSWDNNVYALDAKTGAKLWSYNTGRYVYSSPAVVNGVVYIGSLESYTGYFYAFALPHGDEAGQEAASKRPDWKMLRPDFSLKASQPVVTVSAVE